MNNNIYLYMYTPSQMGKRAATIAFPIPWPEEPYTHNFDRPIKVGPTFHVGVLRFTPAVSQSFCWIIVRNTVL